MKKVSEFRQNFLTLKIRFVLVMFAETDGEIAIEADPPKALRSDKPIRLEFKNESEDKIDMFWHNFKGSKIQYKTIEPGDTRAQWTYVTHPWSAAS